jgi:hypothetical protein
LYAIGTVENQRIIRLFFVYGIDYAASPEVYERISSVIRSGVCTIPDVAFSKTKELGRINRIDPLGITHLRIRGMWGISHPAKVFSYVYTPTEAPFECVSIINTQKYNAFPAHDRIRLEHLMDEYFTIKNIRIKTPDNPMVLRDAKLITLTIPEGEKR